MVWESFFKPKKSISKKDFWLFIVVNLLIGLILNQFPQFLYHDDTIDVTMVLFICTSILAVIKVNGISSQKEDTLNFYMNRYDYLKLFLVSIAVGLINLFSLCIIPEKYASYSLFVISLMYSGSMVFLYFIIFLLLVAFLKRKITYDGKLIYFFCFSFFSVIIQFVIIRFELK